METETAPVTPPDPGQARTLDELVERLRRLKLWAGDPSYDQITDRINTPWRAAGRPAGELARRGTVVDCFRPGRRRLNEDLVVAIVEALHPDVGYVTQWRQALRVTGGESPADAQVRVQDTLPEDLPVFTGRTEELRQLQSVLSQAGRDGGTVVISAIEGMAGIGKTRLAVHAAHRLTGSGPFDRVLFVNLRGYHADPAQPPADPAAVLDGFLRLLGVAGQRVPHGLTARSAAFRERLAGTRTLILLDNAADAEQAGPLLPDTPGCAALITSRRRLTGLDAALHLAVDVFTPDESVQLLERAAPEAAAGADPQAAARIAARCGHLPLALGLVAGHIRGTPGWTLTDHAERLDERHDQRRLESGVELTLNLSYHRLPAGQQRLLRLAALHPGQDFDAYAAAALSDLELSAARDQLAHLCRDHLLQQNAPGRYTFHDLVRSYAVVLGDDEDPPPMRRAALTRLFDYYLAASAAAMDTLFPAEKHHRPRIPPPATPMPVPAEPESARAWLDTERPTLVAVAVHAALHGLPTHTTRLSATLFRYLGGGGYFADAQVIHRHARRAAQDLEDPVAEANALASLGTTYTLLGQHEQAADHLEQALSRYRLADEPIGHARALANYSVVLQREGRYRSAAGYLEQALTLFRRAGDVTGEANALSNLGFIEQRLGRYESAVQRHQRALTLLRRAGNAYGEANTLANLSEAEIPLGLYEAAGEHLRHALDLFQGLGSRHGEAATLDGLGTLERSLGRPAQAVGYYSRALSIAREIGNRHGQTAALSGLGEATQSLGRIRDALAHFTEALAIAEEVGLRDHQARAHAGLAEAHAGLAEAQAGPTVAHAGLAEAHAAGGAAAGDADAFDADAGDAYDRARYHWEQALGHYDRLGMPQADGIRARLAELRPSPGP